MQESLELFSFSRNLHVFSNLIPGTSARADIGPTSIEKIELSVCVHEIGKASSLSSEYLRALLNLDRSRISTVYSQNAMLRGETTTTTWRMTLVLVP
jgi:hypothetical protein